MSRFELNETCFEIVLDSINEKGKKYIDERQGIKEQFYSSLISWISSYIAGKTWYIELTESSCIRKNKATALYDIMKMETGISLKRDVCEKIINTIENFKESNYDYRNIF